MTNRRLKSSEQYYWKVIVQSDLSDELDSLHVFDKMIYDWFHTHMHTEWKAKEAYGLCCNAHAVSDKITLLR